MLQTEAKSEFFSNDREIHHFNDVGKELYLGKHVIKRHLIGKESFLP